MVSQQEKQLEENLCVDELCLREKKDDVFNYYNMVCIKKLKLYRYFLLKLEINNKVKNK